MTPRAAQHGQVVLHRRVLPHLGVHRRADHDRRPGGEQGGGEQVVGDAGGVGAEQAGGGRAHHDEVGRLAEAGVRDGVGARRTARSRTGSDASAENVVSPTKRVRPLGQDGHDVGAGVDQAAADLDGLVGGDAAGDAEDDPAARPSTDASVGARARPRRPASAAASASAISLGRRAVDGDDLVGGDLLEGDRERLAGHRGDLRRDDRAEALAQLAEVGVDLAGPLGGQGDQA